MFKRPALLGKKNMFSKYATILVCFSQRSNIKRVPVCLHRIAQIAPGVPIQGKKQKNVHCNTILTLGD